MEQGLLKSMHPRPLSFFILLLCLSIIVPVTADTFSVFDKFPIMRNGENGIWLQSLEGARYVDLAYITPLGNYCFGTESAEKYKPLISRVALPNPSVTSQAGKPSASPLQSTPDTIYAVPSAVISTGHDRDAVIRVTIPGSGGNVRISGDACREGPGDVRFYVYLGENQYNQPLWQESNCGKFNLTIPYAEKDQVFFGVSAEGDDSKDRTYWKYLQLETIPAIVQPTILLEQNQLPRNNTANASPTSLSGDNQPSANLPSPNQQSPGGVFPFTYLIAALGGIITIVVSLVIVKQKNSQKKQPAPAILPPIEEKAKPPFSPLAKTPVYQSTTQPVTLQQLPPEIADQYTESEFLGKGGFARVFKAKRKDGQEVAVKIPISLDAATGKSFIAEIKNWTDFEHKNIVRVFDYNIMPVPYFEMELCDSSLAEMKKPLDTQEAAWILYNVCEGLKYVHVKKIIHRDLKPQNILLRNGVPKISDWGLSRIVSASKSTTVTSFTPYYAAPEQIGNKAKDERTDIWQLGVILYELVTNTLPFMGDSMVEIGMGIATKDPAPPSKIVPEAQPIDPVIMKCLKKDPSERYQSVLELQRAVGDHLRITYAESLKMSVGAHDLKKSAYYCGDLVLINLMTGDPATALKYLSDLINYTQGEVTADAKELSEQLRFRVESGITEVPDELINKAEFIVHKVSAGFRDVNNKAHTGA